MRGVQLAALTIFAALSLYPVVFVVISSFKDNQDFYTNFWGFASTVRWRNYATVAPAVLRWIGNTLVYSAANAVLVVTITALSGYAFARFTFRHKEHLFSFHGRRFRYRSER